MRLGFVGVGSHARKLAGAFRACGAEIVAHARLSPGKSDEFGTRMSWRDWLSCENENVATKVDAVVAVAPPEVTTEVTLACLRSGTPCLATKPLLLSGLPNEAISQTARSNAERIHVDLWRLYSPAWLACKAAVSEAEVRAIKVVFVGNGPVRRFSSAFDYGPHAVAFIHDLLGGDFELVDARLVQCPGSRGDGVYHVRGRKGGVPFEIQVGAGSRTQQRTVVIETVRDRHSLIEGAHQEYFCSSQVSAVVGSTKDLALHRFCENFLAQRHSRTLEISFVAHRMLEQAVDLATMHP